MNLSEICKELNNWFDTERRFGTFTISDGSLEADFLQDGQYFRIVGSVFNDGVYTYPVSSLTDEAFDGAVWAMAVPPDVLQLEVDVNAWQEKYGDAAASPFQSESFGGYSYSKGAAANAGESGVTWQGAFASRLNQWRKVRP